MSEDYKPGQNDPYQEPPKDEMTIGDALRTIAERTAFRTEYERDQVYAAIAKEHDPAPADEPDGDEDQGDGGDPAPVKATPAKKTAARASR